jgi:lysophospholipase L1-like esterase
MNRGMNRAKVAMVVLTMLLAASLAGNVALVKFALRCISETTEVRLDPMGLAAVRVRQIPLDPPEGLRRVIFVGDSRAEHWPIPTGLDGFEFRNRGVGSQTTRQVLERFDRQVAGLRPKVVILELGVNDLKAIPLLPERRKLIVEQCKANIAELVAHSRQVGARVVLVTIFSLGDIPFVRRLYVTEEVSEAIRDVNAYLRGLASEDVRILDAGPTLDDPSGKIRAAYQDGFLHLNLAGYKALEPVLREVLATVR